MNLRGKVALVTGGAHRVGRAIALALARRGASIVLHYGSSAKAAAETAAEIRQLGVAVWPVQADLAETAEIERLFATIETEAGRLDVAVNSAASFERIPFDDTTAEDFDRILRVNLRAPFLCTQRAARLMRATERPPEEPALVLQLIDLASVEAWRGFAAHGVAKAGLKHLTRLAARELAPAVRVNAIMPGAILPPPGVEPEADEWRKVGARLPLGRTGAPEDVGHAAVYLAENDFVTGIVLPVEGGESLLGAAHR